ncbi:hypothetical protein JC795_29170 [Pseudomonas veronii]|jgi:hypothetical protein|uniref:hypothetical protein n=1 Tax=Pseudomonas veronii TaxID=76761 RepID=UPI0018E70497|nr:hypothetical protein [Pseudomonas veronii]MBJ2182259.1 hypothetical protein [Pseudomonas veronii]
MIGINRAKAESITVDRLRVEREPLLVELDTLFMRALESGEETDTIASKKQALRDITERDLSTLSLTELAALTIEKALAG